MTRKLDKAQIAEIKRQRDTSRAELHQELMAAGASHSLPPTGSADNGAAWYQETHGYEYQLETPLGILRVSPYEPNPTISRDLWVHARFDEPRRAANVIGTASDGSPWGVNPHSGKWNFTDHRAFLAAFRRSVFRSLAARVADAIFSAWLPLAWSMAPADGVRWEDLGVRLREAANNSVAAGEEPETVELFARDTINHRIELRSWPQLTTEQIDAFVAAADKAAKDVLAS